LLTRSPDEIVQPYCRVYSRVELVH
jgi:hypothetical protein